MKLMTGEIGKFILDDKQVGGFKNWTVIVNRNPVNTEVRAMAFWLFERVTNKLTASFYAEINGKLKLIRDGEVTVAFPEGFSLDTMIKTPLKMTFKEGFSWLSD